MPIESLEIFPTTMTLESPIPMSSGAIASTGNVVVKLTTSEGLAGWGEGVEAPALTGQRQSEVIADLRALEPIVVGSSAKQRTQTWAAMTAAAPTATTAIAAIDIALHDLGGKELGVPVYELVGGLVRDRIPALALVGSGDPDADAESLSVRYDQGYRWFKIKLGMGPPDAELTTLGRAIDLAGEHGVVCGDANEAWTEEDAAAFLDRLSGMGVRFIEQPTPRTDPSALTRLAASSPVPLCADESAGDLAAVLGFSGGPLGGVSLKLIKHGGIIGVMRGAAICSVGGLEINMAGKVVESSISAAANLHCAAAMDRVDYGCSPANQGVVRDVTTRPVSVIDGWYPVPQGPGLGVDVDERALAALAT